MIPLHTVQQGLWGWWRLRLLCGLAACVAMACLRNAGAQAMAAGLPNAPSPVIAVQTQVGQEAALGSIYGTVTDADGAVVSGAAVTLTIDSAREPLKTVSGTDGQFSFTGLAAGKFTVTVAAAGMEGVSEAGTLNAGENYEIRPMALAVAEVATEVDAMSVHDQAAQEIKVEEKQRLIGIVPNFYVAYNWDAAPLSTGQKFKLALMNTIDPVNIAINGAISGYQQWRNDFNGYGQGAAGYFSRFGANEGDLAVGTFVGGAILPSILHQDPRYFYKGTGTVKARLWYAVKSTVICRGDNGKWQPNYSGIGGDLAAGAIANLYYPASDRDGASLTIEQGLIGAVASGLSNIVQEFLFKKVTPHSANYPSTTPLPQP